MFAKNFFLAAAMSLASGAPALTAPLDGTHVHGLAYDPADPERLLVATHNGLFAVESGAVSQVSTTADDFMGFTIHPGGSYVASGHPAGGGNLGVIISEDGGRNWESLSEGANGPVDFHQVAVSPIAPDLMVGVHGKLQVSRDGGQTWTVGGSLPASTLNIALSPTEPETLYAATEAGLFISPNLGADWTLEHAADVPSTTVTVGADGFLYAYDLANGLSVKRPGTSAWESVAAPLHEDAIVHLAVGEGELAAATYRGHMLQSNDGGLTWEPLLD